MPMREALFTALFTAKSKLPVELEYDKTETEYFVKKNIGTIFPAACKKAPEDYVYYSRIL